MILLEHDKHGRMHVYSESAVIEHALGGWRVVGAEEQHPNKKPGPVVNKQVYAKTRKRPQ